MAVIPFIDIFAGPGGLSEGFSRFASFRSSRTSFESRLAIEKDPVAARTLELRSFYRTFPEGKAPEDYYQVIRGQRSEASLALHPAWQEAKQHVWNAELGVESEAILHTRIKSSLGTARNWVLLGGPPCQAYSLMGRARMTGIGAEARQAGLDLDELRQVKRFEFASDHRHRLYLEYLRIVAVHQPAVFVMENVKGILSSRIDVDNGGEAERVFAHIRRDLSNPWEALLGDSEYGQLRSFRREEPHVYRLYSLVIGGDKTGAEIRDSDFLIRSEEFGIPQRRHRVILLGVRDDIRVNPTALTPATRATVRTAIEALPKLRSSVSRNSVGKGWFDSIRAEFKRLDVRFPENALAGRALFEFLTNGEPDLDDGGDFLPAEMTPDGSDLGRWYADDGIKGVIQHVARSHMVSDLVRYLYASSVADAFGKSPALEDWPKELLPDHRNVAVDSETGRIRAEGFHDRFKVQIWDQPSSTVTSHIAKDGHYFIHPDPMQCRSLTVREAARLQTFPDNYHFCGNRTQQYHQVGNAVPPYLACQIAGVVAKLLEDAGLAETDHG